MENKINKIQVVCRFVNEKDLIDNIMKVNKFTSLKQFVNIFQDDLILLYSFEREKDSEIDNHIISDFEIRVIDKFGSNIFFILEEKEILMRLNNILDRLKISKTLIGLRDELFFYNILCANLLNSQNKKKISYGYYDVGDDYLFIVLTNNSVLIESDVFVKSLIREELPNFLLKKDICQKPKRNPLTKSIKFEVFKRDGYKCVACKTDEKLEIEHKIPISRGGTDDLENLETLCKSCNIAKSNRILKNYRD